jgi:hypothetical protein
MLIRIRLLSREATEVRPDNLAFFISGIRICLAGYPAGYQPLKIAGYPAGYPAIQAAIECGSKADPDPKHCLGLCVCNGDLDPKQRIEISFGSVKRGQQFDNSKEPVPTIPVRKSGANRRLHIQNITGTGIFLYSFSKLIPVPTGMSISVRKSTGTGTHYMCSCQIYFK